MNFFISIVTDRDIIEPNSSEFTRNISYRCRSYILLLALAIAALYYSQLLR